MVPDDQCPSYQRNTVLMVLGRTVAKVLDTPVVGTLQACGSIGARVAATTAPSATAAPAATTAPAAAAPPTAAGTPALIAASSGGLCSEQQHAYHQKQYAYAIHFDRASAAAQQTMISMA